jgi:hypothetical protein
LGLFFCADSICISPVAIEFDMAELWLHFPPDLRMVAGLPHHSVMFIPRPHDPNHYRKMSEQVLEGCTG